MSRFAGEIDRELGREMIRGTQFTLDRIDREGMVRPQLIGETIGADAMPMGSHPAALCAFSADARVRFEGLRAHFPPFMSQYVSRFEMAALRAAHAHRKFKPLTLELVRK